MDMTDIGATGVSATLWFAPGHQPEMFIRQFVTDLRDVFDNRARLGIVVILVFHKKTPSPIASNRVKPMIFHKRCFQGNGL
jgi:hypothetical protein